MRTHTGEKTHRCQICQTSFAQICYLKKHMQIHYGEKPHECQICEKAFTQSGYLKIHMETHSGEKPCNYQLCQNALTAISGIGGPATPVLPVQFTAFTNAGVTCKQNERLLMSIRRDTTEKNSCLANMYMEECLSTSITKSPEDTKPFLEKSFGCGLCGEMFEIEKEFQDHWSTHRFSPPDDSLFDMC